MGGTGCLTVPPSHLRQALTRMAGTPDRYQYSGVAWGSHCSETDVSLHITSQCVAALGHAEGKPP